MNIQRVLIVALAVAAWRTNASGTTERPPLPDPQSVEIFLNLKDHAEYLTSMEKELPRLIELSQSLCSDPRSDISSGFRDIAGDAYDNVKALEIAELQGETYYQSVLQGAELAVVGTKRKANSPGEQTLASCIEYIKLITISYRNISENLNIDAEYFGRRDHLFQAGSDIYVGVGNLVEQEKALISKAEQAQKDIGGMVESLLKPPVHKSVPRKSVSKSHSGAKNLN